MTSALELQLSAALRPLLSRQGHLPWCNHRAWLGGYGVRQRHACDLPDCDGEGVPCIPRCIAVRQALVAAERGVERQGALL